MRITVGTPYYGMLDREFQLSIARLNEQFPEVRTVGVFDCSYIDQAKSLILTKHMHGADVVCVVDHDMIFEPQAIIDLAESAMEADAVVGAAYCTRAHDHGTAVVLAKLDPPVTFFEGGQRVRVSALGGGFMAYPTRVLRDVVKKLGLELMMTVLDSEAYPFFHTIAKDGKWWGEDLSFCQRLEEAGEKLWLDTRIRVGHKGKYIYHLEDGVMSVPRFKSLEIPEKGKHRGTR